MDLTLKIVRGDGSVAHESTGQGDVCLAAWHEYAEGDKIVLEMSENNAYMVLQLDDAQGEALVYMTKNRFAYPIPFAEKRANISPKVFSGGLHYLRARVAEDFEVAAYRNLALNVADQQEDVGCYPHAYANVETRGESVFAARNAIDGVVENRSHGEWPYASWGINQNLDAEMTIDFGREIMADKIVLYTRADFPHDCWWTSATFTFSNGDVEVLEMEKSALPHVLTFAPKKFCSVTISKLIQADDPSPFPALTQMEVYGREVTK